MMYAVAVLLPWLALMLRGRVFQGIFCLILQITLIGWLPAAIWAVMVVNSDNQERRHRELLESLQNRR
ncbi:YqaE/Pmp3 family membrane protein [Aquabacter spiritensis]|uniref:Proteolipid membrane potential modulator n=1 Tax=Aquabacter spiritensis TaxID=933073 RepID=A0A4R3M7A7_9HYPH|nr:YqaE/Pmp3 family membrane protein [Aquabacter spiritensis]TCT08149.1 proteolipid membrane potential modulator [Aquabacter spiritensis]